MLTFKFCATVGVKATRLIGATALQSLRYMHFPISLLSQLKILGPTQCVYTTDMPPKASCITAR
jgi:hypothetical protein